MSLEGLPVLAGELDEQHAAAVLDPPDRGRGLLEEARERGVIAPEQELRGERKHELALGEAEDREHGHEQEPG